MRLGVVLVVLLVLGLAAAVAVVIVDVDPDRDPLATATTEIEDDAPSVAGADVDSPATEPTGAVADRPRVEVGIDVAPAPVRPDLPRALQGRVVDEATGEGVAGALVLYRVVDEVEARRVGRVVRTAADGRFEQLVLPEPDFLATASVEVWATAPGYRVERVRPERGTLHLALRPADELPPPGWIAGVVVDARDRPFAGRVLVRLVDEFQREHAQFATADTAGRFELPGVPAGAWRAALGDDDEWQWLVVPSDGVVDLRVRVGDDTAAAGSVQLPLQSRELIVRGVGEFAGDAAVVVVRSRPSWMFRARATPDGARFPRIPVGRWTLEIREAGRTVEERRIEVGPGTDPLELDLTVGDR